MKPALRTPSSNKKKKVRFEESTTRFRSKVDDLVESTDPNSIDLRLDGLITTILQEDDNSLKEQLNNSDTLYKLLPYLDDMLYKSQESYSKIFKNLDLSIRYDHSNFTILDILIDSINSDNKNYLELAAVVIINLNNNSSDNSQSQIKEIINSAFAVFNKSLMSNEISPCFNYCEGNVSFDPKFAFAAKLFLEKLNKAIKDFGGIDLEYEGKITPSNIPKFLANF